MEEVIRLVIDIIIVIAVYKTAKYIKNENKRRKEVEEEQLREIQYEREANGQVTEPYSRVGSHRMMRPPLPSQSSDVGNGDTLPVTESTLGTQRRQGPKRLPTTRTRTSIYDYPRCYIHRCYNRPGEKQVIFWNREKEMYQCHRGHYFTGKER